MAGHADTGKGKLLTRVDSDRSRSFVSTFIGHIGSNSFDGAGPINLSSPLFGQ